MITSIQNDQVKYWIKLHQRKYREKFKQFLIEGHHLVEEAYHSDWKIEQLIFINEVKEKLPKWHEKVPKFVVSSHVFNHLTKTVNPQGIAAIVNMKKFDKNVGKYSLLIDAIQDPGNLGTLIRTADAAGFSQVILGKGTVDLFNEKVIRATQGSVFHLPIRQNDLQTEITQLREKNVTILASALDETSIPYDEAPISEHIALIVGNEGAGIDEQLINMADERIKIPIYGKVESLNVSVAAGILMYHIRK